MIFGLSNYFFGLQKFLDSSKNFFLSGLLVFSEFPEKDQRMTVQKRNSLKLIFINVSALIILQTLIQISLSLFTKIIILNLNN